MKKSAFSLVELIISVTIVTLIAVIGVSINSGYKEKAEGSQTLAQIQTLSSAFSLYKQENNTLPLPMGNKNYFSNNSLYTHDETGAYGVYGFVRDSILPKKYLNITPLDTRTKHYFAYGKTLGIPFFELAAVVSDAGEFHSKVIGDYTGENGPKNLIREYNGSNFVFDGAGENFPYNPNEKSMNARFGSVSGIISVNNQVISSQNILSTLLVSGDTIKVSVGGSADIYFSDGSVSTLGSSSSESEITLASLNYKNDGFFTKVQIALRIGTLWTKATRLDTESEFEVATSDTTAAVRGTIFGITKIGTSQTQVEVISGSVEVFRGNTLSLLLPQRIPLQVPNGVYLTGIISAPKSIIVSQDGGVIPITLTSLDTKDTSFGNNLLLELVEAPKYGGDGKLLHISLKKDTRFALGDILRVSNSSGSINLSNTTINVPLPTPLPSTIDLQVCRKTTCSQTLSVSSWKSMGVDDFTLSEAKCSGILVGAKCIDNRLKNEGYTLVGAADYTQSDDLYTSNGGKIDGGYNEGVARTNAGYFPALIPSSGKGIMYNLDSLLDTDEFIIEFEVNGYGLKKPDNQYIWFQDAKNSLQYVGGLKKFKSLVVSTSSLEMSDITESHLYTIQFKKETGMFKIKIINQNTGVEKSSGIASTSSLFDSLIKVYIGGRYMSSWTNTWVGGMATIRFYKKLVPNLAKEITSAEAINLKKVTESAGAKKTKPPLIPEVPAGTGGADTGTVYAVSGVGCPCQPGIGTDFDDKTALFDDWYRVCKNIYYSKDKLATGLKGSTRVVCEDYKFIPVSKWIDQTWSGWYIAP